MNILVVDNETVMANSLRIGLGNMGYRVVNAYSGQQALDLLAHGNQTINLVITDYLMPGMDGLELMKVLRKANPTLPIVIMTAYADKSLIIEALKHRCDGFIEKPFRLDQLAAEIERIMSHLLQNSPSDDLRQLLPRIAHQINNPLTAISGYAQLIQLNRDNGEMVQDYAEKILAALKIIGCINQDIMNGRLTKEDAFTPVELNTLLDGCLKMFQGMIVLKGIQVKKIVSVDELWVMGDRFSLEHVFNNLVLNAIEAMDGQTDKTLTVSVRPSHDLSSAEAIIEDTGCGIRSEFLKKIFEPYFTDKSQGNGLGLVVLNNCVEKHGGRVLVESRMGIGSRFTISLPAVQMSRMCRYNPKHITNNA
jgi:signal transduction histidine kinase